MTGGRGGEEGGCRRRTLASLGQTPVANRRQPVNFLCNTLPHVRERRFGISASTRTSDHRRIPRPVKHYFRDWPSSSATHTLSSSAPIDQAHSLSTSAPRPPSLPLSILHPGKHSRPHLSSRWLVVGGISDFDRQPPLSQGKSVFYHNRHYLVYPTNRPSLASSIRPSVGYDTHKLSPFAMTFSLF